MHRRCRLLLTRMRWSGTVPPHPGHQQAAPSVHYTTSCKHSLVLLRMGEIIARNMLSWLQLLIKLFLLYLVGFLYYCINDAPSHKHQKYMLSCRALTLSAQSTACTTAGHVSTSLILVPNFNLIQIRHSEQTWSSKIVTNWMYKIQENRRKKLTAARSVQIFAAFNRNLRFITTCITCTVIGCMSLGQCHQHQHYTVNKRSYLFGGGGTVDWQEYGPSLRSGLQHMGYTPENRRAGLRIQEQAPDVSLLQCPDRIRDPPSLLFKGHLGCYVGGRAAVTSSWPLTYIQCRG